MKTVKINTTDLKLFAVKQNNQETKFNQNTSSKVLLNTSKTIEIISVSEILRVEAYQNYTKVFVENDIMLLCSDSLSSLQQILGDGFCICHKSHLVNLNKILRYYKDGQIELINGEKVPVARRRKAKFIEILEQWIEAYST